MPDRKSQDWTPCKPGDVSTFVSHLVNQKRFASLTLVGATLLAASAVGLVTWMVATTFTDPKPRGQETKSTKPHGPLKAK